MLAYVGLCEGLGKRTTEKPGGLCKLWRWLAGLAPGRRPGGLADGRRQEYSEHRRQDWCAVHANDSFYRGTEPNSSTTSLRFDLPLLSSTHIAHYAITALAKRDSNTINKGNTSRNMRSHSAIYRVGRDFFTGLQKHVSVTTGVLLCSLFWNTMSQLTACLEATRRESLPTEGREAWPGAGHGFTTALPSDSCLSVDPRRFQ